MQLLQFTQLHYWIHTAIYYNQPWVLFLFFFFSAGSIGKYCVSILRIHSELMVKSISNSDQAMREIMLLNFVFRTCKSTEDCKALERGFSSSPLLSAMLSPWTSSSSRSSIKVRGHNSAALPFAGCEQELMGLCTQWTPFLCERWGWDAAVGPLFVPGRKLVQDPLPGDREEGNPKEGRLTTLWVMTKFSAGLWQHVSCSPSVGFRANCSRCPWLGHLV